MILGRPHIRHILHGFLVHNGPITKAQCGCRIRETLHNGFAGVAIQQAVDFDFERYTGNLAGTDDLLFAGHQKHIQLIRLHTHNYLGSPEIFSLQCTVPLEDLRVLCLIKGQLPGKPCVNVAADQKGRGGRGMVLPLQLRQRRRFTFLESLKLRGAHVGHVHFRRVIILSRNNR